MREIKFRIWNNEKMSSWEDLLKHSRNFTHFDNLIGHFNNPDVAILMQYTGLKDKNGKEIYEGDILESERENACQWVVVWFNGWYLDRYVNGKRDETVGKYGFRTDLKIIGNIYENPELIKQ